MRRFAGSKRGSPSSKRPASKAESVGLTAGLHTVSIWVRGNATSCGANYGDFDQYVYVIEE